MASDRQPLAAEKRPDAVTLRTLMSVVRQIRLLAVDRSSYVRVAVDINTPFTVTLAFMVVTPDIVRFGDGRVATLESTTTCTSARNGPALPRPAVNSATSFKSVMVVLYVFSPRRV
jgi:hypothetical protein